MTILRVSEAELERTRDLIKTPSAPQKFKVQLKTVRINKIWTPSFPVDPGEIQNVEEELDEWTQLWEIENFSQKEIDSAWRSSWFVLLLRFIYSYKSKGTSPLLSKAVLLGRSELRHFIGNEWRPYPGDWTKLLAMLADLCWSATSRCEWTNDNAEKLKGCLWRVAVFVTAYTGTRDRETAEAELELADSKRKEGNVTSAAERESAAKVAHAPIKRLADKLLKEGLDPKDIAERIKQQHSVEYKLRTIRDILSKYPTFVEARRKARASRAKKTAPS